MLTGGAKGITVLPNESRGSLVAQFFLTLIVAAFLSVFWIALLTETPTGDVWVGYVVLGLVTLIALGAVYRMLRLTFSLRRFGDVALRIEETPRPGTTLKARIGLRRHEVLKTVSIKLLCRKVRWTKGTKNSTYRNETEHWARTQPRVAVAAAGPQAWIDFSFVIPPHLPGRTVPLGMGRGSLLLEHDYYEWRLELEADVPGVDLVRSYDLPMQPPAAETLLGTGKNLAAAELLKGTAPGEIAGKLEAAGLTGALADQALGEAARTAGLKHVAAVQPFLATRGRERTEADAGSLVKLKRSSPAPLPDVDFSVWKRPSAFVLIAANLVPVAGVLFFGWDLLPIMLLFWFENVIVGLFNVLRMLNAGKGGAAKLFIIPFFIFHYGMFCLVHGMFVMTLFGEDALGEFGLERGFAGPEAFSTMIAEYSLLPAVLALAASHGYSYFANYLGAGEYREADPQVLMAAPYGRVVVLHVLILLGGFLIMMLGSPVAFIVLLVVLKTGLDLFAHGREHGKYAQLAAASAAKPAGGIVEDEPSALGRAGSSAAVIAAVVAVIYFGYPPPAERLSAEALAKREAERTGAAQSATPQPSRNRGPVAPVGTTARPSAWDGPAAAWHAQFEKALALQANGRIAEAETGLRRTLDSMEAWPAGPPPEAARVLSTLADLHYDRGDKAAYEVEMARALEILESFPPLTVRERLGADGERIDREALAREFGDYFWEHRRYDRGFEYYRRAHDSAPVIQVTEAERNRRLAFSSAGMMATACMLKDFDTADRAMAELKERIQRVDPGSKKQLDYWVRTGEPRLKKRKC